MALQPANKRLVTEAYINTLLEGLPSGDMGRFFALGNQSGALSLSSYTLDSQVFTVTAIGNLTLSASAMPTLPEQFAGSFSIVIQQDATGGRTLTLDPTILASYGNKPALSTAANAVDILSFMWTGSVWVVLLSAVAIA